MMQGSPSLARDLSLEAGSESAQDMGSVRPEEDPHDAECNDDDISEQRQERLHDLVCLFKPNLLFIQPCCRSPLQCTCSALVRCPCN